MRLFTWWNEDFKAARKPLDQCEYVRISDKESLADRLEYFASIRRYIEHEDGLINSRLTWSLTFHGFLLTAYGVITTKLIDIMSATARVSHPHRIHIVELCLIVGQFLICVFGFLVGRLSFAAIDAARCALVHLRSIAHAGAALRLERSGSGARLERAVFPGFHPVKLSNPCAFVEGEEVLVDECSELGREIVRIKDVGDDGFRAHFRQTHDAGATVRPLGFALLPKVVNGGAPDNHFPRAARYYLALPAFASMIWLLLMAASALLFVWSMLHPEFLLPG